MLNEIQAQRLAVLLTDKQPTDILTLAQVIKSEASFGFDQEEEVKPS